MQNWLKKIAGRILKMDGPNKKEGYRLAIMFRGENGKETSPGERNKDTLAHLDYNPYRKENAQ